MIYLTDYRYTKNAQVELFEEIVVTYMVKVEESTNV